MPVAEFTTAPTPPQVGSPSVGPAPIKGAQPRVVPFRLATLERTELIGQETAVATTASEQTIERTIEGTGFVYMLSLDVNGVTAGNGANVTFAEDGPYNSISSVQFKDVTGPLVDLDGYSLHLLSLYGGWKWYLEESSSDTNIWQKTTGSGGTGGSFRFHLYVPVALNRRNLIGLLGNQDRAQQYQVRHNLNANSNIYGVAPTSNPNVTIKRNYHSYAVPNLANDMGIANQVVPPTYGVIHYCTKSVSEATPLGGSTINHYLRRIGNTVRTMVFIFRSNGTRANAESNMPTGIQMKVGNQLVFNEDTAARRELMYQRYGFDAPSGVLVYDWLHDFVNKAGAELGNDYIWSQQIANAQFQITYPSGFGSTNNSLTIVTSDLTVPPGVNIYA